MLTQKGNRLLVIKILKIEGEFKNSAVGKNSGCIFRYRGTESVWCSTCLVLLDSLQNSSFS